MATATIIKKNNKVVKVKNKNNYSYINYKSNGIYNPPFRIKFTNIGIRGYSPLNPAPIGIAVIGVSNYIL